MAELEKSDCFRNLADVAVDDIVRFLRGKMMLASQLFRTPSVSFIEEALRAFAAKAAAAEVEADAEADDDLEPLEVDARMDVEGVAFAVLQRCPSLAPILVWLRGWSVERVKLRVMINVQVTIAIVMSVVIVVVCCCSPASRAHPIQAASSTQTGKHIKPMITGRKSDRERRSCGDLQS